MGQQKRSVEQSKLAVWDSDDEPPTVPCPAAHGGAAASEEPPTKKTKVVTTEGVRELILKKLSEKNKTVANHAVPIFDKDKNGKITAAEFQHILFIAFQITQDKSSGVFKDIFKANPEFLTGDELTNWLEPEEDPFGETQDPFA